MVEQEKKSKKWQWILVIVAAVIMLIFLILGGIDARKQQKAEQETESVTTSAVAGNVPSPQNPNSADSILLRRQSELIEKFGRLPSGYLWDVDGTLLSLGDKSMAAEDVVYAYLNGIRQLDFSTAQKFSRGSMVVSTYSEYYSTASSIASDYSESFVRNLYRLVLLSIKVKAIESNSVFAENKQVFTITLEVLDLSDKDFWLNDKLDIYKNLYIFASAQDDGTKADQYLYDYILNYYKSGNAKTRKITVDLTVEKYPDLDTGWLVSADKDIDSACRYTDGKPVVRFIKEMYASEWMDYKWYFLGEPDPSAVPETEETEPVGTVVVTEEPNVTNAVEPSEDEELPNPDGVPVG